MLTDEFVISDVTIINHYSRICGPKLIRFNKQKLVCSLKKICIDKQLDYEKRSMPKRVGLPIRSDKITSIELIIKCPKKIDRRRCFQNEKKSRNHCLVSRMLTVHKRVKYRSMFVKYM